MFLKLLQHKDHNCDKNDAEQHGVYQLNASENLAPNWTEVFDLVICGGNR